MFNYDTHKLPLQQHYSNVHLPLEDIDILLSALLSLTQHYTAITLHVTHPTKGIIPKITHQTPHFTHHTHDNFLET